MALTCNPAQLCALPCYSILIASFSYSPSARGSYSKKAPLAKRKNATCHKICTRSCPLCTGEQHWCTSNTQRALRLPSQSLTSARKDDCCRSQYLYGRLLPTTTPAPDAFTAPRLALKSNPKQGHRQSHNLRSPLRPLKNLVQDLSRN